MHLFTKTLKIVFLFTFVFNSVSAQDYENNYSEEIEEEGPKYIEIENNKNYLIVEKNQYWSKKLGLVDLNHKEVFPSVFRKIYAFKTGGFLLFDGNKTTMVSKELKVIKIFDGYIGENNAYFVAIGKINTQFPLELFDVNGNSILKSLNLDLNAAYFVSPLSKDENFNKGIYVVSKEDALGYKTAALFNVLTFKWVTPFEVQSFQEFGKGFFIIKDKIKESYLYEFSEEQNFRYNPYYDKKRTKIKETSFTGDYYENGVLISSMKDVEIIFGNKLAHKNNQGKLGVIDYEMKTIIPYEYDKLESSNTNNSNLIVLSRNGNKFLFDEFGSQVFKTEYQEIVVLNKNVFQVKSQNKWGFVSMFGKEIIPVKYDTMLFAREFLLGKINNTWEIVKFERNLESKVVEKDISDLIAFKNTGIAIKKDNKWGMFNDSGKTSFLYDEIQQQGNYYSFRIGKKVGIVTVDGKEIKKASFDNITVLDNNYLLIENDSKYGVYEVSDEESNMSLSEIIPIKYDFIYFHDSYYNSKFTVLDRAKGISKVIEVERKRSYNYFNEENYER